MTTNNQCQKYLVVTDLDGTLLDHYDYSWNKAGNALAFLKENDIPVVINTSKTATEVITLQKSIGLHAAFIVENGSAIFIPDNLQSTSTLDLVKRNGRRLKLLGQGKDFIVEKLREIRADAKWRFEGFSDWSTEKIIEATGLSQEAAAEASQREFSEPLIWQDSEENYKAFCLLIAGLGLKILKGGRFIHVLGETDKGKAALWLKSFYEQQHNTRYKLIALGDGPNDVDMLNASDIAVVVKSPAHAFPTIKRTEAVIFTKAYGPEGWNEAINTLKSEII